MEKYFAQSIKYVSSCRRFFSDRHEIVQIRPCDFCIENRFPCRMAFLNWHIFRTLANLCQGAGDTGADLGLFAAWTGKKCGLGHYMEIIARYIAHFPLPQKWVFFYGIIIVSVMHVHPLITRSLLLH
jgi:hypothetical protein